MSKYDPIGQWLNDHEVETITLTFERIETEIGVELPFAARHHRQWWANAAHGHAQSRSWMRSGYRAVGLDLKAETVSFIRDPDAPSRQSFGEHRARERLAARAAERTGG
jgi:hypothetical protein